jgi:hypothetical protein
MLFRTVGHMLSLRVLHVSRVSNGKGVSRRPQRAIPGQPSALQSWQKAVARGAVSITATASMASGIKFATSRRRTEPFNSVGDECASP